MYLYNVSLILEESIHQEIMQWVHDNILHTSNFDVNVLEMLQSPHEGITFCLQVTVPSETHIQTFQEEFLLPLQTLIAEKYKDKAFLFDSTMKYLKR